MKVNLGKFPKRGKRKISIKIDSYDLWNLDHTLSLIIHPALVSFKEANSGHPAHLKSKQWSGFLTKMIRAFEILSKADSKPLNAKQDKTVKEGLALFAEYFHCLWN